MLEIMKKINKVVLAIFSVLFITSCEKIQEGYISDTIIYTRNPFTVEAGKTVYSETPNLAGSSRPVTFELLEVRNESGEIDTELTKLRDLYIWTAPYNSLTDTTIELIQKKRQLLADQPTMHLLPGSGQLMFTEATSKVVPGKYKLTMKMSNTAGERTFKDIVSVVLVNKPYHYENQNHNIAATGSGWTEPGGLNEYDTKGVGIKNAEAKVTHNPNGPNKIHLVVKDKNGNPWNWGNSEMVKRGDRPCLEYAMPWSKGVFGETDLTYEYPFAPFPFGKIATPGGNQWERRIDYRILNSYVAIDGLTPGKWHCNLVFYFSFNFEGEWTFEITFPSLTRIPKQQS